MQLLAFVHQEQKHLISQQIIQYGAIPSFKKSVTLKCHANLIAKKCTGQQFINVMGAISLNPNYYLVDFVFATVYKLRGEMLV